VRPVACCAGQAIIKRIAPIIMSVSLAFMLNLINRDGRRTNAALTAVALLLLIGSVVYNIYLVWATPNPGIDFDARWQVLSVDACKTSVVPCAELNLVRPNDRLLQVGDVTYEDYVRDPSRVPFAGYLPGDNVPLTVLRNGETIPVFWRMQTISTGTIINSVLISFLVYGAFWLVGTFVLLYVRPADVTWLLLIGLFYMMTIWLATGLYTLSNVASSAIILRVFGWLMTPVMVHLHLVAPRGRLDPRLKAPVSGIYAAAVVLLVMQLTGRLPWLAYLAGFSLAAVASIGLLSFRLLTPRAPAEKQAARLMLAGIVISLVPGLIFSALPLLLDTGASDVFGPAVSILALPVLPLFYTYAIYKHRLGIRERRVNRLLVQYTLVVIYFILLVLVFVILSNWIWTANSLLSAVVLLLLSFVIAFLPLRRPIETVFDRLSYGTLYSHRAILSDFTERIPAAVDTQELLHLLKFELSPELEIRQSALLIRQGEEVQQLYSQGVALEELPSSWAEVESVLQDRDHLVSLRGRRRHQEAQGQTWIRLALPLRLRERTTGAWLFGRREMNDLYSRDDTELLERLSGLVAVTLDSGQLLQALSTELDIRKQAETRLAEQSERLRFLHQIDKAVLAADTPAEIARAAFSGLSELVPCVRVSVMTFDADRGSLNILAVRGSGADIIADDDAIPLRQSPGIDRLRSGQVFVSDDVTLTMPEGSLARALAPAGVRAVCSAPLIASGAVFGALNIANSEPSSYTPTHMAIVEEVATSVALAIHNARLREEVDKSSQELRRLSARLIDAQEDERKRLSHELHDEIGQILTAISLNLAAVERNLPENDSITLREQLADANDMVVGLTDQVRSLSLELRPSMLHDLGLVSTLRWYVANYGRRNKVKIHFETSELPEHLSETVEITAYRVVQEALTNASRHAHANSVDLAIHGRDGLLQVIVEDDGCGFEVEAGPDAKSPTSGIGLALMRERVSAANGRFEVDSTLGKGTRICAEIPFRGEADR
jgi:signal transduction histidine kinase